MYTIWLRGHVCEFSFGKHIMISGTNGIYVFASTCRKTSNKQTHALKLTHINPYGFDTLVAITLLTSVFRNVRTHKSRCKCLQILLDTKIYFISPSVSWKNIVMVKAGILKIQEGKGLDYHRRGMKNPQR